VNRNQRLRELIHGGPYDPFRWIIMVRLAVDADNAGLVNPPELAHVSDWIGHSEKWALNCLRHLRQDGWITQTEDGRWDISVNLRQGSRAHADLKDRAPFKAVGVAGAVPQPQLGSAIRPNNLREQ
jgi:hypothetical protein